MYSSSFTTDDSCYRSSARPRLPTHQQQSFHCSASALAAPIIMARLKPVGIRLCVWRLLTAAEQRTWAFGLLDGDCGRRQALLSRLEQIAEQRKCQSNNAVLAPLQRTNMQQSPCGPKPKRSKRVLLTGELEGWEREDRCTAMGRRYSIWIGPCGTALMSRVQALRWCAQWG